MRKALAYIKMAIKVIDLATQLEKKRKRVRSDRRFTVVSLVSIYFMLGNMSAALITSDKHLRIAKNEV